MQQLRDPAAVKGEEGGGGGGEVSSAHYVSIPGLFYSETLPLRARLRVRLPLHAYYTPGRSVVRSCA